MKSLQNGRIKCQWHGACFNAATGDIEDMPGLDSLQNFEVRVAGNDVSIVATEEQLKNPKRRRPMAKCEAGNTKVFVVIGGGSAGAAAVESIRANGYNGRLVWISKENTLPVDRIRLSKAFDLTEDKVLLRSPEFYAEYNIESLLGTTVTSLDHDKREIVYAKDGHETTLKYDSVLVATGGSPMTLRLEGGKSENVFTLRTLEDSKRIGNVAAANPKARFVVVGSNFIGMECAASLSKMTSEPVVVVARGELPFKPFGSEIGKAILDFFTKNGVVFKPNAEPKELKVTDNKVHTVVCADGSEVPCDYVICGVGVEIKSSTSFIKPIASLPADSTLIDARTGALNVDQHLRVVPGFFAAGDMINYPDPLFGTVRIEHWAVAGSMGKLAGENMAKEQADSAKGLAPYTTFPYFWTMNFGKGVRYAGHASSWDEIIFDMEPNGLAPDTLKFAAYFVKDDRVLAVATVARDPIVSRAAELMRSRKMPSGLQLKAAIKEHGSTDSLILPSY